MWSFFSFLLTFILVCTSFFTILVILTQRPSANSGMGSSLGGGVVESAFGSDTTKVLTKWTIGGIVTFFIVALSLSMMQIYANSHGQAKINGIDLKSIIVDDENQSQ
ncbi:MAG: preprotein translocase subunit SecG [Puniceicoccales bacterium]|jgi:protein translocase SecG subunit|nr:preprotein translocase subunit SecG [Puniceicoccales bacterium]